MRPPRSRSASFHLPSLTLADWIPVRRSTVRLQSRRQLAGSSNASFEPMSNKAVCLIVNYLAKKLPKNVRFIFTTRRVNA